MFIVNTHTLYHTQHNILHAPQFSVSTSYAQQNIPPIYVPIGVMNPSAGYEKCFAFFVIFNCAFRSVPTATRSLPDEECWFSNRRCLRRFIQLPIGLPCLLLLLLFLLLPP